MYWNGSARTTTFVSDSQLTAQITAADIASATQAQVTVQNGASQAPSNALLFTVSAASALAAAKPRTVPAFA